MVLPKERKKKILDELKEKIERQKSIIFVDFGGLKANDMFKLRREIKLGGGEVKVVKKTLANFVLKEKFNLDIKTMKGEIALIFAYKDEILPAKIAFEFSKENPNLKILGGILENKFLDSEKIIELAKLPSKEELLSELLNRISAPLLNLINVLSWNLRNFVLILNQIQKVKK